MTKVWEETWVTGGGRWLQRVVDDDGPENVALFDYCDNDVNVAAIRLAACAPEMARLLLEAEWSGWTVVDPVHDEDHKACPWCKGSAPFEPHERGAMMGLKSGHYSDCRWLALMRKAGIR